MLYAPLEPSIFSLGGVVLAIGLLFVAKRYEKMMNLPAFFRINLLVAGLMLVMILAFLVLKLSYMSALFIYICYQATFLFGSYLVRMETLALKRTSLLSMADVLKQKGYLAGMVLSYLFYKGAEFWGISDKELQVYILHVGLLVLQFLIIALLLKAFRKW